MFESCQSPISSLLRLFSANAFIAFGLVAFFGFDGTLSAQNLPGVTRPRTLPTQQKRVQKPARPGAQETAPEAEEVRLQTKDGFNLVCSWYPPPVNEENQDTSTGKSTVPYIVLHDWESSRRQTVNFARFLQSKGNGVLIPDMRGHGASTLLEGKDKPVTFDKMAKSERGLLLEDIEACKRHLVQRNNAGEINIDLLTVVAIGKMAPVATRWVLNDWTLFPPRSPKGIKQAQDVKGLVLVSPRKKFGSFSLSNSLRHPMFTGKTGYELPMMVVWGEEDKNCAQGRKVDFWDAGKDVPT